MSQVSWEDDEAVGDEIMVAWGAVGDDTDEVRQQSCVKSLLQSPLLSAATAGETGMGRQSPFSHFSFNPPIHERQPSSITQTKIRKNLK